MKKWKWALFTMVYHMKLMYLMFGMLAPIPRALSTTTTWQMPYSSSRNVHLQYWNSRFMMHQNQSIWSNVWFANVTITGQLFMLPYSFSSSLALGWWSDYLIPNTLNHAFCTSFISILFSLLITSPLVLFQSWLFYGRGLLYDKDYYMYYRQMTAVYSLYFCPILWRFSFHRLLCCSFWVSIVWWFCGLLEWMINS